MMSATTEAAPTAPKSDRMTVEEFRQLYGLSKARTYAVLKKNLVPHFRVGRSVILRRSAVLAWIEAQEQKAA